MVQRIYRSCKLWLKGCSNDVKAIYRSCKLWLKGYSNDMKEICFISKTMIFNFLDKNIFFTEHLIIRCSDGANHGSKDVPMVQKGFTEAVNHGSKDVPMVQKDLQKL
jgi:hypothetical protein